MASPVAASDELAAALHDGILRHDDGVVLTVSGIGTVVNQPGPTGEVTTPFNVFNPGAAGNFNFLLNYAECCGAPADLIFEVNNAPITSTPAPSRIARFGPGLFAVGLLRTQRQVVST